MIPRLLFICLWSTFLLFSKASFGQVGYIGNKSVHTVYKPENFTINKIDTVINDSIRIFVRHYTLMDSYANDYGNVTPDSIECRYRDYALEISLSNHGRQIFNNKLVKSDFISDSRYWKNLTLFKVWLESYNIQSGQVRFRVGLGLPGLYSPVISTLIIGHDGQSEIKLN